MPFTHVMVVEDDANTLTGYLEFLSAAGFEPTGVSDGAEALRIAVERPPAIVVTDITLPGMNGFALATALHEDLRTRDVPVIGLTAHWGVEVRGKAVESCMRAVLVKPCVPAHLVAELRRVLASPAIPLAAR
jgi:DNA-binding response OmpR family regulator